MFNASVFLKTWVGY